MRRPPWRAFNRFDRCRTLLPVIALLWSVEKAVSERPSQWIAADTTKSLKTHRESSLTAGNQSNGSRRSVRQYILWLQFHLVIIINLRWFWGVAFFDDVVRGQKHYLVRHATNVTSYSLSKSGIRLRMFMLADALAGLWKTIVSFYILIFVQCFARTTSKSTGLRASHSGFVSVFWCILILSWSSGQGRIFATSTPGLWTPASMNIQVAHIPKARQLIILPKICFFSEYIFTYMACWSIQGMRLFAGLGRSFYLVACVRDVAKTQRVKPHPKPL